MGSENKAGDGSRGDTQAIDKGAGGSDILTGPNRTPLSPQISMQAHVQTPGNTGTISKIMKGKDFHLFPPVQDQPNKRLAPHSLD